MITILIALKLAQAPQGKDIFEKRCTGCHALDNERAGPRMRGVFGRKAGAVPGFPYSDALKDSGISWNAATLDKWLSDSDQLVPGNDMAFRVPSAQERAAIIEFLRNLPPSVNGAKR